MEDTVDDDPCRGLSRHDNGMTGVIAGPFVDVGVRRAAVLAVAPWVVICW